VGEYQQTKIHDTLASDKLELSLREIVSVDGHVATVRGKLDCGKSKSL